MPFNKASNWCLAVVDLNEQELKCNVSMGGENISGLEEFKGIEVVLCVCIQRFSSLNVSNYHLFKLEDALFQGKIIQLLHCHYSNLIFPSKDIPCKK